MCLAPQIRKRGGAAGAANRSEAAAAAASAGASTRNELLCLAAVPLAWDLDATKLNGFRIDLTWRKAALSVVDTSHNEFWNLWTDVVPLLTFAASCLHVCSEGPPPQPASADLYYAIVATIAATVFQHAASLFAHTFFCVSARLSHAIWFIDYAGIFLEFVWNAPVMALIAQPSLSSSGWLPWWNAVNVLATIGLLGAAAFVVLTYSPPASTGAERQPTVGFFESMCLYGAYSAVPSVGLLVVPNFGLTMLAAHRVDASLHAVAPLMLLSLLIKGSRFPERFAKPGTFDFSILHSHALWHVCVYVVQNMYLVAVLRALAQA